MCHIVVGDIVQRFKTSSSLNPYITTYHNPILSQNQFCTYQKCVLQMRLPEIQQFVYRMI